MLSQEIVLGFIDEKEDGADAGNLGADKAADIEDERVAVGVFKCGGEQLRAGT